MVGLSQATLLKTEGLLMVSALNVVGGHTPSGARRSAAEKHNDKGVACQVKGDLTEAEAHYRRAVSLKRGFAEAWSNLGVVLLAQRRPLDAVVCLERAVALRPSFVEAYGNLTQALTQLGRVAEATAAWRRLLRLRPDDPDGLAGLAIALTAEGRHAEAFEVYGQALRVRPGHGKTLFALGLLHLQLGDLAFGLPLYEHRYEAAFGRPAHQFAQPVWRGQPLAGKRILLHHDQGLGDTLQFLRYLPLMEAAGADIILLAQPALRRLVRETPGSVASDTFDLHCPLPSLPLAFGTTLATIPADVPYLAVPEREQAEAAAFAWPRAGLRVGLLWSGNPDHPRDAFRSLPLAACEPILGVAGIHFYSLQLGPSSNPRLANLSLDAANMADAAAKMLHLDVVITVDTAIAHLAGALGLRVWILLDHWPDWRWLLDREDSPWYPTARLFRQPSASDWVPVVEQVAETLRGLRDEAPDREAKLPERAVPLVASAHVL